MVNRGSATTRDKLEIKLSIDIFGLETIFVIVLGIVIRTECILLQIYAFQIHVM